MFKHPSPSPLAKHWTLDPEVVFLNHGSFGACPREVLDVQNELRCRMEKEPVKFFVRELEPLMDEARTRLADFVGADPESLAFVTNATTGVNTVLKSFPLNRGDELVVSNHEYGACRNALHARAAQAGAEVVVADIPFPGADPDQVVSAFLDCVTSKTRLLLIDHVTSQTGLVMPIQTLVDEFENRGIAVLVDGAHAPGMIDLDLTALGASFYTANCHKWICAPKGAALLAIREDWRNRIRPLVISHGATVPAGDRGSFRHEFDWTGTFDPTPFLCIPAAIESMQSMVPGGWPEVRRHNHRLALRARDILCSALGFTNPCPETMIGALVTVPLPGASTGDVSSPLYRDPLQDKLLFDFGIEVPVIPWPDQSHRLLRISAQLYNTEEQYHYLADALGQIGRA